jgi:hypothetical protein
LSRYEAVPPVPSRRRWISTAILVATLVACLLSTAVAGCSSAARPAGSSAIDSTTSAASSDAVFAKAFAEHKSGIEVTGQGTVQQLLADDTSGERHQRFIVELASGQTLLIDHNIDVAPRVPGLQVGDAVSFKGEYVWNAQGGLVHWTHRDPEGKHSAGWLESGGRKYQ